MYDAFYDNVNVAGPQNTSAASTVLGIQSSVQIQRIYNASGYLQPDFTLPNNNYPTGASIPTFYVETETSGGSNLQAASIMGYVWNSGSQDANATAGRVDRTLGVLPVTGTQEATGVWGSAYNESTYPGFTAGSEFDIYNQVPGTVPGDTFSINTTVNGAVVAGHFNSASKGSPANALVLLDAAPRAKTQ